MSSGYTSELSIVIPTYRGPGRLEAALGSLAAQTADPDRYEAVVVVNGPADGYAEALDRVRVDHPRLRVRATFIDEAGAGNARNVGVAHAGGEFVTFLDDDDWLQPEFVRLGLANVAQGRMVVLPLIDQVSESGELVQSRYGRFTEAAAGQVHPIGAQAWPLAFNACKFVPREVALRHRFDVDLRSGEDLVYFAGYLTEDLEVAFVFAPDAHYVRVLRAGSVSRQEESYDFRVTQRLACIQRLDALDLPLGGRGDVARLHLMRSQAQSVRVWLEAHPEDRRRARAAVAASGIQRFPEGVFSPGPADDVAFCYAFVPAADTSAIVAAKVLAGRGRSVDVISNDMSLVRDLDPQLAELTQDVLNEHLELKLPVDFYSGAALSAYALDAFLTAERRHRQRPYRRVYSRALWAPSHAAAALFKLRHWPVVWSAEFSDPLRFSTRGGERRSPIVDDEVTRELRAALAARGLGHLELPGTFALVEAATMALADELIFTNTRQQRVMLERWDDDSITSRVMARSTVRPHPEPPPEAYTAHPCDIELPHGVTNIGYFGNLYPNRGMGAVLDALDSQAPEDRTAVHLHVFTSDVAGITAELAGRPSRDQVTVRGYLPYFEFLNLTTRLDVLLVTDVVIGEAMSVNPYLPSKLSDYRGSGRPIWALVDRDSPMSELSFEYVSPAADVEAIRATLDVIAGAAAHGVPREAGH
ncbi:glycosyltransferase [Tessaracoccus sp. OS52]|uniref:glycosyltransferase n=1 Tax=Tessaracoccus sp. OS52 TaxID=2886691 RepID=UPI001D0FC0F0|nr:glycosyltransferase [Tessaracoccus sp. OS52]MCC2594543.1 glycosyltransferase [Tessaracoccus sp. OS52]